MGTMYEEGLSLHKNGFTITFVNLSFVSVLLSLFVKTTAIV